MTDKYLNQLIMLGFTAEYKKDVGEFLNHAIETLRIGTAPSKERRLKRHYVKNVGLGIRQETTLDQYYVDLINDTLREIRRGRPAYIFNLEQIREVFRFEPEAKIRYLPQSDSFCVTL